jgi:hypothetical protein
MSRWGEMFHALSQGADTVDTVDTVAEADAMPDTVSHSVHCVTGVDGGRAANPPADPEQLTVVDTDELDECAALVECGAGVPRSWAEGFAVPCTMAPPAGFSPERWQRIVDAAGVFLDRWAADAIRCGWSDLDVFGADADRPDARFDAMGLVLLLDRMEVVGIDPDGADLVTETGTRQRYRRRPLPANTVSLWALGRDD